MHATWLVILLVMVLVIVLVVVIPRLGEIIPWLVLSLVVLLPVIPLTVVPRMVIVELVLSRWLVIHWAVHGSVLSEILVIIALRRVTPVVVRVSLEVVVLAVRCKSVIIPVLVSVIVEGSVLSVISVE